jgi:hypothetical protein
MDYEYYEKLMNFAMQRFCLIPAPLMMPAWDIHCVAAMLPNAMDWQSATNDKYILPFEKKYIEFVQAQGNPGHDTTMRTGNGVG